jgi:hypothetical protein
MPNHLGIRDSSSRAGTGMTIELDPGRLEQWIVFDFIGRLSAMGLLEIGCGNGRLAWRPAGQAAVGAGIDPDPGISNRLPGRSQRV